MIKPILIREATEHGWYIHFDVNAQKGPLRWGVKPYGAWLYELTAQGWRDEVGCLDCGPMEPTDLVVGPIEIEEANET